MGKAVIGIDKSKSYRMYLSITTDVVEESRRIHDTTPLASAGLGRVLTAAGLMGLMLKEPKDRLTIQFKGDGPAKEILATAKGTGEVKGYISDADVDLPLNRFGKLDVGGSLGNGQLTVIKDMGLKEPYMGKVPLVTGEIAEDLTSYFYRSEQQHTSVALGVKIEKDWSVDAAGGLIIQMLPDADEECIDVLEKLISEMPPITSFISDVKEKMGTGSEEEKVRKLAEKIFKGVPDRFSPEILDVREIRWRCGCSKERLGRALMTIGRKDLKEIIEEDHQAELQCQFCLEKYYFTEAELIGLMEAM